MSIDQLLENPYMRLPMTFDTGKFFGPFKLVEFILKTVTDPRTIAPIELLALPGMGKSTLLRYLWHPEGALYMNKEALNPAFQKEPVRLLPILAEFRRAPLDMHPFLYLYEQFYKQYPEYKSRLLAQNNLDIELPDFTGHAIPERSAEAVDLLEKEVKKLGQKGFRTILLLDDFDLAFVGLDLAETTRLRPLRDFVAFVMTMEQPLNRVNQEAAGSPFFQNTPLIRVGGLTSGEARRLIEVPAQEAGKPFHAEDVDFVLKYTGGHPYLIILGGKALWEIREMMIPLHIEKIVVTKTQQELLLGQLEEDFKGPFQLYWEKLERHEQDTLIILSRDHKQQTLERIHYKALRTLLEMGLVSYTSKGDYELFSPLFRNFLENIAETPATGSGHNGYHGIQTTNLSGMEASLYEYLRRNAEKVCSYEELWQAVWQPSSPEVKKEQMRRRMQVTVSRLRSKLEQRGEDIISVREQGYRLLQRGDS